MDDTTTDTGTRRRRGRAGRRWVPVALAVAVLAAGCGGKSAGEAGDRQTADGGGRNLASIGDDGKDPERGGELAYALGGESDGGFCLPEAQLSSGITVASAIYDTLTMPNADGEAVPYLAKSVEPNADFTEWTIGLRDGITFHDGTKLDATVVKNNLDAYRGTYPARKPTLFLFVFEKVADVTVVDPLTVKVTTSTPWVAFASYLSADGRLGMMAQAQLDDTETCDRKLIGTGPFKQKEWKPGVHFKVERNDDYWQTAPDGEPYPYLDGITFRPITEEQQRINAMESGDLDVMTAGLGKSVRTLQQLQDDGTVALSLVDRPRQVSHLMLNAGKPPFDDLDMRRAFAHAVDVETLNDSVNEGLFTVANGPFGKGGIGHLEDTGFPAYDPAAAKKLVDAYVEKTGSPVEITLNTIPDAMIQAAAELVQQQAADVGIKVNLRVIDQATLISLAIGGEYQATLWTQPFSGDDPDQGYVWWHGQGNPVNFGRIDDPELDRLLEEGRSETDPEARKAMYEGVNRQFAKNVWNIWLTYTGEAVATGVKVHGLLPPELPNGDEPYYIRTVGDPMYALWKE